MTPEIAIIDYGMGNLRSVAKALERIGAEARIIDTPQGIGEAAALVLPGVGAFGQAMSRLTSEGFDELVKSWVKEGRPFLGICLGMQLIFTESEEFGPVRGLDLIPGRVVRFQGPAYERNGERSGLKVPHIGWNHIKVVKEHPVVADLPKAAMAYFVHSYYCVPDDPEWTVLVTDHGIDFTSAGGRDNIFATQFHPEKSGEAGLKILTNFVQIVEKSL